jgi:hypothetical protein
MGPVSPFCEKSRLGTRELDSVLNKSGLGTSAGGLFHVEQLRSADRIVSRKIEVENGARLRSQQLWPGNSGRDARGDCFTWNIARKPPAGTVEHSCQLTSPGPRRQKAPAAPVWLESGNGRRLSPRDRPHRPTDEHPGHRAKPDRRNLRTVNGRVKRDRADGAPDQHRERRRADPQNAASPTTMVLAEKAAAARACGHVANLPTRRAANRAASSDRQSIEYAS